MLGDGSVCPNGAIDVIFTDRRGVWLGIGMGNGDKGAMGGVEGWG